MEDNENYNGNPTFDFRVHAKWGYKDQSPRDVVYMKRWQQMMHADMKRMFGEADTPNLYEVDQYFIDNPGACLGSGRFASTKVFGEGRLNPDNAIVATYFMLYWAKSGNEIIDEAKKLFPSLDTESQRTVAYLGVYDRMNIRTTMFNNNRIPSDFMNIDFIQSLTEPKPERRLLTYFHDEADDRAAHEKELRLRAGAQTVRRMICWFASDHGQDFIQACERNLKIKQDRKLAERMGRTMHPVRQWLSQRPA